MHQAKRLTRPSDPHPHIWETSEFCPPEKQWGGGRTVRETCRATTTEPSTLHLFSCGERALHLHDYQALQLQPLP